MIDFIGLELLEFHDLPLESIKINDGLESNLELEILIWSEKINDYINYKLIFGNIHHIAPENILIEENSDLEIYSFDYHLENDLFYGKLSCLTGLSKPSLEIDFSCKTVTVEEK